MKRLWGIVLLFMCACVGAHSQDEVQVETQDSTLMPHLYVIRYVQLDTHLAAPTPYIHFRKTDRGLFGGEAFGIRIYGDITLPTITSACLLDVGAAMSKWGGLLGECPRWFTMFHPMACPRDELFGSAKANSAIMVTMRTYF